MERKLIKLNDGILIEISQAEVIDDDRTGDGRQEVSSKADKAFHTLKDKSFSDITDKIIKLSDNLSTSLDKQNSKRKPSKVSIELGLSFEAKGNIFVVEASGKASINVKIDWDLTQSGYSKNG